MADGPMIPETAYFPSPAGQEAAGWRLVAETGIDHLAHTQAMLWGGMIEVAEATKALSQSRLQANMNTCRVLVSCHHPMELAALHQKHVEDALAQYQDHAQDVSERLWQCVRDLAAAREDEEGA